jgi:hypothetical protein
VQAVGPRAGIQLALARSAWAVLARAQWTSLVLAVSWGGVCGEAGAGAGCGGVCRGEGVALSVLNDREKMVFQGMYQEGSDAFVELPRDICAHGNGLEA